MTSHKEGEGGKAKCDGSSKHQGHKNMIEGEKDQ